MDFQRVLGPRMSASIYDVHMQTCSPLASSPSILPSTLHESATLPLPRLGHGQEESSRFMQCTRREGGRTSKWTTGLSTWNPGNTQVCRQVCGQSEGGQRNKHFVEVIQAFCELENYLKVLLIWRPWSFGIFWPLLPLSAKSIQASPLTVTPVRVTLRLQWQFFGPKKTLLILKMMRYSDTCLHWHFFTIPALSLQAGGPLQICVKCWKM